MTPRRAPRMTLTHPWRREAPLPERLLHLLGASPAFADALLGDLAEERARRMAEEGARAANLWYAREALRSAPHLLWNAIRHGGWRGRASAVAVVATAAVVPAVALLVLLRGPAPASLIVDGQDAGSFGIVLNTMQPVQLAMRVLDAKGRVLPSDDVRYEWIGGTSLPVTSNGVVTCTTAGDAMLRASIGKVNTTMVLRCRPVKEFLARLWVPLVAGGPSRHLQYTAVGPDGRSVELLAGDLRVGDSSVATLRNFTLTPVAPGHTFVTMRIGGGITTTSVSVFEPVRSFDDRRPDQNFVVVPVTVARRGSVREPLPIGEFWLLYEGATEMEAVPAFSTSGPAICAPRLGPDVPFTRCVVRGPGASLRIAHPGGKAPAISGSIFLELTKRP